MSEAVVRFAASLFEIRLLVQARGWERIDGPCVVLACAPREQRTLALIALGLGLAERHCRIEYLGGFTPIATLAEQNADLVVVAVEDDDLHRTRARGAARARSGPDRARRAGART